MCFSGSFVMRSPVLSALLKASVAGLSLAATAAAAGADVASRQVTGDVASLTVQGDSSIKLLQLNGAVEHELNCYLSLPEPGVPFERLRVIDSSSETSILKTDGTGSLLSKRVHATYENGNVRGLNLTANLDFDEFVGKTTYGVEVSDFDPNTRDSKPLASTSASYVIAGTTVFNTEMGTSSTGALEETRTIVSGAGRELSVPYTDLMGVMNADGSYRGPSPLELSMTTQYLDGSVVTAPTGLGNGNGGSAPADYEGMVMKLVSYEGQIVHNVDLCAPSKGSYDNAAGVFVLPDHCGATFYTAPSGDTGFGLAMEPYRAGKLEFGLDWPDFTANDRDFLDEAWTSTVAIDVTGSPPPVITSVSPSYDFRQAGGETLDVEMFNAGTSLSRECSISSTDADGSVTDIVFGEESGAFKAVGFPGYSQSTTFATAPGSGKNLDFSMAVARPNGADTETVQAVFFPGYHYDFSYDGQVVRTDSISPMSALESGGTSITLEGYFPHFDTGRGDAILFDGRPIPGTSVTSASDSVIGFTVLPRTEIGRNYMYGVSVQIGSEVSSPVDFRFITESASASFLYTGTSLKEGRQELGRCNSARFTAQVLPVTAEATKYDWVLTRDGDASATNLLDASRLINSMYVDINSGDLTVPGDYTLSCTIHLSAVEVTASLPLRRTDIVTIGVFLHTPTARSISNPEAPLRMSAMVDPPGCGAVASVEELMFEWTFMEKVTTFSYHSAVSTTQATANTETPARLGWEYIVPQSDLLYGNHVVNLKVYSAVNESIFGVASANALINMADLVPVIRSGESRMDVTTSSTVEMTAGDSYDPDVTLPGDPMANITYAWECMTSPKDTFERLAPCGVALLPSATAASYTLSSATLKALTAEQAFIRYSLVVTKGRRVSKASTLIVAVVQDASVTRPAFTNYEIVVRNTLGEPLDASAIKYYEPVVIDVVHDETDGLSWIYSLVSPADTRFFFFSSNLISDQGYYNPDSQATIGNHDPLGIRANALGPRMTYVFRIDFEKVGYEMQPVFVTLTTREQPTLRFEMPQLTEGTTSSVFSLNAAPSFVDPSFAYYFVLTEAGESDSETRVCVGGCTGYPFVHMRIGLPGRYTLTALLYDTQGTAQLASNALSMDIVIRESNATDKFRSELQVLFHQGDDNTWTSLANDLAYMLSSDYESEDALSAVRRMAATHSAWELERGLPNRGSMPDLTLGDAGDFGSLVRADVDAVAVSTADVTDVTEVTDVTDMADAVAVPTTDAVVADEATFVKKTVYELISGASDIFCNAFPNTMHSDQGIKLVLSLASQKCIDEEGVYKLLQVIKCCGENVPPHTDYSQMVTTLPAVFARLEDVVLNTQCSARSSVEAVGAAGRPNNLAADVNMAFMLAGTGAMVNGKGAGHTGDMAVALSAKSMRRGAVAKSDLTPTTPTSGVVPIDLSENTTVRKQAGDNIVPGAVTSETERGFLTVAVASNSEQLPQLVVEGKATTLKGLQGRGKHNFFYMKPQCFEKVFSPAGDESVIFSYAQVPNFVVESNFQDAPKYGETSSHIHWTMLSTPDKTTTKPREMKVDNPNKEPCFCWRMAMTNTSGIVGDLTPGAYTFKQLKEYGVNAEHGSAFQYDELPVHIEDSSVEDKWVEVCMAQPGMLGTSPRMAFVSTVLAGFGSLTVAGIVLGALLLVVVAMAGAWLVASRVVVAAAAPPRALGVGEVFVDRDIWGRSTAPMSPSSPEGHMQ